MMLQDEKYCLICFSPIYEGTSFFAYFQKPDQICGFCRQKLRRCKEKLQWQGYPFFAVYYYDAFMESLLFQLKEGRDIALAPIFLSCYKKELEKRYRDFTMVFMPSNESKTKERGFFALEELFSDISLPKVTPLIKTHNVKQSLQPMQQRGKIANGIALDKKKLAMSKLLLVDDVCTSGNTLSAALHQLKEHPFSIEILVISVHPFFLSQYTSRKEIMKWEKHKRKTT